MQLQPNTGRPLAAAVAQGFPEQVQVWPRRDPQPDGGSAAVSPRAPSGPRPNRTPGTRTSLWCREQNTCRPGRARRCVLTATPSSGVRSWWRWVSHGTRMSSAALTAAALWQTWASWRSAGQCTVCSAMRSSSLPPASSATRRSLEKSSMP